MKRLDCIVQDYAWGDPTSIPNLLGMPADGSPAAELWMGAHPKAPSAVVGSDALTLDQLISAGPARLLGEATASQFGQLPFLFKVLAAAQPLSIQTHPSLAQAQAGFAREDAAGVDRAAPERTYRDPNHKPELICALTPFAARVGFRPVAEAHEVVALLATHAPDGASDIGDLAERLAVSGEDQAVLHSALGYLLRSSEDTVSTLVGAVRSAAAQVTSGPWADELAWVERMHDAFPGDIGVVVALLLNHVELQPGEAVFLPAGNLHAYLKGTGVELMANSDNVVRGGLTGKHIDVEELLAVVDASPLDPEVQRPDSSPHTYESPVPEFALTRVTGRDDAEAAVLDHPGPKILLSTAATWQVETAMAPEPIEVGQGQVIFVGADEGAVHVSAAAEGELFVAGVGQTAV